MPIEKFANQVSTTVSSGGTDAPSALTSQAWTVASSAGWPTAATGLSQFHICEDDATRQSEIMLVTNVSGTAWTVTRGVEGTTPVTHPVNFTVVMVTTAEVLNNLDKSPLSRAWARTLWR